MSAADLPAGWRVVKLGEVAEVRLGRQRSPKNHTGSNMRPYLRAANVGWDGLKLDDVMQMHFSQAEEETYTLRVGDIVLSEASGSIDEVGKPAVWHGDIERCCFQNTLIRIRGIGFTDPDFLALRLRYEALSGGWARQMARGVGINHLGATRLAQWSFALPPIAQQRDIARELERRLSHIDAASRYADDAVRQIEVTVDAILDAALAGKLRGAEADVDAWTYTSVDEVAQVQGGIQKQPKRAPGVDAAPFLRVANVGRRTLDLRDVHRIALFDDELDRYRLMPGDLLVVEGNGSRSQIGRAAMWHGTIDDCVHQNHLIRVRPNPDRVDPRFLELAWNAPATVRHLSRVASSTSGLYTLSAAKVKAVTLVVPPIADQLRIVAEVDRRLSLLDEARKVGLLSRHRAGLVRKALLNRATTGRLLAADARRSGPHRSDNPAANTRTPKVMSSLKAAPK